MSNFCADSAQFKYIETFEGHLLQTCIYAIVSIQRFFFHLVMFKLEHCIIIRPLTNYITLILSCG